jgi:hypothetical protein
MQNKENTLGYVHGVDYNELNVRVDNLLFELKEIQQLFEGGSLVYANLHDSRFALGYVQDHILRVRGIRGN